MPVTHCVFDAYGTLFDVASAARVAATEGAHPALARHWPAIAESWRRKQLEYSWLRTIMGAHADFWQVTQDGLDWALEAEGLAGDAALRGRLLALYRALPAYPEVPAMLARLGAAGVAAAILSNGSRAMLDAAVLASGIGSQLAAVLSVDDLGIYKPAAPVYRMVTERFGCAVREVLFVSANGWDAAGAAAFGFRTLWVNRAGQPVDRLPGRPDHVATDLVRVPELLAA